MDITFQARETIMTPAMREQVTKVVRGAFAGVKRGFGKIVVRFFSLSRKGGGKETLAEVRVEMPDGPQVLVTAMQEDPLVATDMSARRAAHRVERLLALRRRKKD